MIRAFHQAGRCIGCGECDRVCPANIPLSLLNRKMGMVAFKEFGYRHETDMNAPTLIGTFSTSDHEENYQVGGYMKLMKIEKGNLSKLMEHLKKDNFRVIGVTPNGKRFSEKFDETLNFMQSDTPPTSISFKEHFFLKTEALFYYKNNNGAIDLKEPVIDERKTVVIGARPCDTASLPILSKVFDWDYANDFFNGKVGTSIIIGMKCNYQDDYCFCNEVGLSRNF